MELVINKKEYEMVNNENVTELQFLATIVLKSTVEELEKTIKTNKDPIKVIEIIGDEQVVREYNGYATLHTLTKQYTATQDLVEISLYSPYNDTESLKVLAGGERLTYDQAVKHRTSLEEVSNTLDDDTAKDNPWLFPTWAVDKDYKVGDRVDYSGKLYKCLQAHKSQADWTPDVAVSLWVNISDPGEEWPEWKQPTGAHDAYEIDAKVSHSGKHWISIVDANVWEPGVYGWDEFVENWEEVVK